MRYIKATINAISVTNPFEGKLEWENIRACMGFQLPDIIKL